MGARLLGTAGAALALGLGVAGCGGGGDALSRTELIERGDDACREANRRLSEVRTPTDLAELAELSEKATPILEDKADKLADLDPPDEVQKSYERMVELAERQNDLGGELAEAARRADYAAVRSVAERGRRLERESDRLARRIGFVECGKT